MIEKSVKIYIYCEKKSDKKFMISLFTIFIILHLVMRSGI